MESPEERTRILCSTSLDRLARIRKIVDDAREAGCTGASTDMHVYFDGSFGDFYADLDQLIDDLFELDPEPWYLDDLCDIIMDVRHADHVLSEEAGGMYAFGWPWSEWLESWSASFRAILEKFAEGSDRPQA